MATLPTDDALRPRTPGAYPREEPMKAAEVGLPSPVTTARNAVARLSFDDLARRTTIPPPSSAPGDRSQTATVGGTSSQNPTQNPGPPDLFGQRGRPSIPVKPNTNRYAFRTRSSSQVAVAEGANRHRSRSAHARNASRTRGHASQPRSRVSARLQPQSSQTPTAHVRKVSFSDVSSEHSAPEEHRSSPLDRFLNGKEGIEDNTVIQSSTPKQPPPQEQREAQAINEILTNFNRYHYNGSGRAILPRGKSDDDPVLVVYDKLNVDAGNGAPLDELRLDDPEFPKQLSKWYIHAFDGIFNLTALMQQYRNTVEDKNSNIEKLEEQMSLVDQSVQGLAQQLREAEITRDRLSSELQTATQRGDSYKRYYKAIKDKNEQLQTSLQEAEDSMNTLQTEIALLNTQIATSVPPVTATVQSHPRRPMASDSEDFSDHERPQEDKPNILTSHASQPLHRVNTQPQPSVLPPYVEPQLQQHPYTQTAPPLA